MLLSMSYSIALLIAYISVVKREVAPLAPGSIVDSVWKGRTTAKTYQSLMFLYTVVAPTHILERKNVLPPV